MPYPFTEKILLPDFDIIKVFKIPESLKEKHFVSLKDMTCDCSEFINKNSLYEKSDLKRACKHIRRAIVVSEIMDESWLRKIIGDSFIYEYYFVPEGKDCAFAYYIGNPWIKYYGKSHYAKRKAKYIYGRFSYSITERRWASNLAPLDSEEIVSMIQKYFPITEEQLKWKPKWPSGRIRVASIEISMNGITKKIGE